MFWRTLARLIALAAGLAAGMAVVTAVALAAGLWHTPAPDARPTPRPTVLVSPVPSPTVPPPTPIPQAVQVNGLGELESRLPTLRGKLIQVTIGEQELTQRVSSYLLGEGLPVSDVRVRLRPGQMILTGTLRESVLAVGFTVTGHPDVVDGTLKLRIDSIDPPLAGQIAGIGPGQAIDLPLAFEAQRAVVTEGQMVVTGVVR